MKRNWQNVAERADKRVFGVEEISDALIPALAGDCRDEMTPKFIDSLRGVFEEREQMLFKDNIKDRLESLRHEAGTGIGRRVIENVVRLSDSESADVFTLANAMEAALGERLARCSRQVEEHYLRKSTAPRANNVRGRLEQASAGAGLNSLARQILKLDNNRPARSTPKRDGLDEGPSIR
jgi:hypothetical protein